MVSRKPLAVPSRQRYIFELERNLNFLHASGNVPHEPDGPVGVIGPVQADPFDANLQLPGGRRWHVDLAGFER